MSEQQELWQLEEEVAKQGEHMDDVECARYAARKMKRQRDFALAALAAFREAAAQLQDSEAQQLEEAISPVQKAEVVNWSFALQAVACRQRAAAIRALPIPPEAEVMARDAERYRAARSMDWLKVSQEHIDAARKASKS